MTRPRTITISTPATKVSEKRFRIRYEPNLVNEDGEKIDGCVTVGNEIIIDKDLLPSDMASTLFHEVIHAASPDLAEEAVLRIEDAVFRLHKALCRMQ